MAYFTPQKPFSQERTGDQVSPRDLWSFWSRKNLSPFPGNFLIASLTQELTGKEAVQQTPVNNTCFDSSSPGFIALLITLTWFACSMTCSGE